MIALIDFTAKRTGRRFVGGIKCKGAIKGDTGKWGKLSLLPAIGMSRHPVWFSSE